MKKIFTLIIIVCFSTVFSYGQDAQIYHPNDPQREPKPPLKDRIFFGGDIGLQFGDVTYIYLAPIIGYKVTPKLGMGGGPTYSYQHFNGNYGQASYESNSYGGRAFGQYRVIPSAIAYAEYSLINSEVYDDISNKIKRANVESFLVGGGYAQPAGGNASFNLMVLFDVIQDRYSYTQNPIIRVGFNIGL